MSLAQQIRIACCAANVSPFLYEFSPEYSSSELPADAIEKQVRNSAILFVLLGESVSDAFWTQAWIGYEIGVARGIDIESGNTDWEGYSSKRVIVVEDIRQGSNVSIPRLDALLLFDIDSNDMWNEFQGAVSFLTPKNTNRSAMIEENYENISQLKGPPAEELSSGNRFQQSIVKANVKCKNCKSEYEIWIAIKDAKQLGKALNPISNYPRVEAECTTKCPSCDGMVTQVFTQMLTSSVPT